uniref:C2H2-type domain-containing protein n=1 Tax=Callorhinchus milii TaxID=7868 RepID=A0A4W3J3X0_CALMI
MVPMGISPTQNVAANSGQTTLSSSAGALSLASLQPSTSGDSAVSTSTLTSVSVSVSTSSKATPQSPLGFEAKVPPSKDTQWPESSCGRQAAGEPEALPLLQSGQTSEPEAQDHAGESLGFSASPDRLASDPSEKPEPDDGGRAADVSEIIEASAIRKTTAPSPPLLGKDNESQDETDEARGRRREVVVVLKSGEVLPMEIKATSATGSPHLPRVPSETRPDGEPEPRAPRPDPCVADGRDRAVSPGSQADCLAVSGGEKGSAHRGRQVMVDSYRAADAEETRSVWGREPALYTCTKCSVYFQEKEFLRRHMLDHFEGQAEDRFKARVRPYSCQECGHAFWDPGSLQKHLNLHQARRARFMEAIQELRGEAAGPADANPKSQPKTHAGCGLRPSGAGRDLEEPRPPLTRPADKPPPGHRAVLATQRKSYYACERCQFTTPLESAFLQHLKRVHQHLYQEDSEISPGPSKGAAGSSPCPLDQPESCREVSKASSRSALKAERAPLPTGGCYGGPWPVVFSGGLKNKPQVAGGSDGGSLNLKIHHSRPGGRSWRGPKSMQRTVALSRSLESSGPQKRQFSTARKSSSAVRELSGLRMGDAFACGIKATGQFSLANSPLGNPRQPTHVEGAGEERGSDVSCRAKAPNSKAQSFRIHLGELKSRQAGRARKRANPTSCNPRALKKGTKEILLTLNVPQELPVAQHRQLLKMTPVIVMGGTDGHWECRSLDPGQESDSLLDYPRDQGLLWKQPSGDLSEEMVKESEELLSRNLLRMFPLVERECPYCPDKFHTGIGLANHVRGHLKRVGISYNTRHFISAEEVTAIEKEFSLQKLKRRALKVRGGAVEKCNLCGAHFDSRAGMSSHARAHLRDLHVMTWSATSSPIDLLNQLLHHLVPPGPPEPASNNPKPRARLSPEPPTSTPHPTSTDNTTLQRNKVVVIDPDDEEVSTLESELRSEHISGKSDLQEKNGSVTAIDTNSQGTPVHSKPQSLPKPASAPLGEEQSLQANKLLNSCQLCGTCFETRKGLSSHARFHLRQFGVSDSESSGAPIGTLYELMKRKGIPSVLPSALASGKPPSYAPKEGSAIKQGASGKLPGEEFQDETTHTPKSPKLAMGSPSKGQSPTAPSPLKKIHPILPKPLSNKSPDQEKSEAPPLNTPQTSGELLSKKLFWSPQDNNTPLNLTVNSEHISCQLCGACFETRKGLSSHSRAHLRHFGAVDVDSKGSPIEALNEFIRKKGIQGALSTMVPSEKTHNYDQNSLLKEGRSHFKSALETAAGKKESAKSPLKSPSVKSPSAKSLSMKSSSLKSPSMKSPSVKSPSMSSQKKPKHVTMRVQMESGVSMTSRDPNGLPSEPYWATSPINLSIGSHPSKDTRCEFCGDYFENRKGLSSHARSHLRQFGVTEWTVNGSPIDTLKELMKRKIHAPGSMTMSGHKMPSKPSGNLMKSTSDQLVDERYPQPANKSSKFSLNISPIGEVPSGSLVPKKVGGGYLSPPPLKKMKPAPLKKVKQEYVKVEFNPEEAAGSLKSEQFSSQQMWQDGAAPLHLTVNQPSKAIRCEFCGDYFENRKGLSSHARSHLRQFGVTEWTVNGSPIATLRKLVKRKGKSGPFRHEPQQEPPNYLYEDRAVSKPYIIKSSVKELQQDLLSPSSGKVLSYLPNSQPQPVSPIGKKIPMGFVSTAPQKKLTAEGGSVSAELKPNYPPSETGSYKPKSAWSPQKVPTSPGISADTCCELCGHYFENRKALASHARAHLRQFGVTEWHINGSPIDTLREWIRQKPTLPSATPPGPPERPIPKPYKNHVKPSPKELPLERCSPPVGKMVKLEPAQPKLVQQTFPASPGVHKTLEADTMLQSECLIPTDLSQGSLLDCPPSSSMPSEDEEPHLKKKRKHPVKLGTCEYCGVTLTTGVGLSNHMRGHLKSGLKRKLPGLAQFEELHERADPGLTDTSADRKPQKSALCGENVPPRFEEGKESKTFRPKLEEARPPRVRPMIFPVPKPEPLSLVKFIGNIYTLKCR